MLGYVSIVVIATVLTIEAFPSSKASKRATPLLCNDGFPRWVRQNSINSEMKNMQIADHVPDTGGVGRQAYLRPNDRSMQELWPQTDYQMSSGPSLATRMMEEEEDTATSSSLLQEQQDDCMLNEEDAFNDDGDEASSQDEVEETDEGSIEEVIGDDPTSQALIAAYRSRWNRKQKAWHTGLSVKHRNFMKVVVEQIMQRKQIVSSKAFRRVYQTFTEAMIQELKNINDTLQGWSRHYALEDFVTRYIAAMQWKRDSRAFDNSWTQGHNDDEIAELRQLLKESGRMRGTKFLNGLGLEGRRRALLPGTIENERLLNPRKHCCRGRRGDVEATEPSN